MQLSEFVVQALIEAQFVERFRQVSVAYSFQDPDEAFENWSQQRVRQIIQDIGYESVFHEGEDFFQIIQSSETISSGMNISLRYGAVEFIPWYKTIDGTWLLSGPLGILETQLGINERVGPPCFRDYDELTVILGAGFNIYEDLRMSLHRESVI